MKVKNDHRSKFSNLSNWKEEAWKKIKASTGFEPVTSAIPVRCSTNWAMKPYIGSEVNLLSSFSREEWNDVKYIWNNSYIWTAVIDQSEEWSSLLLSNCLNWKIYCDDHSSLWSITAVQMYELFHIYFTSFHSSRENELNKLTSLPMYGFIAQLVEHRTGIAEVTGSNPVEALIFFQASSFQLLKLENLLRWSFFTLIYNRSSNVWIISYILHIISLLTGEWTQ